MLRKKLFRLPFRTLYLLYVLLSFAALAEAQTLSSTELLQKSIQYHDPQEKWAGGAFEFPLYESRPNGSYRLTDVIIDNGASTFELTQIRGRDRLHRYLGPDSCRVEWNYQSDIPPNRQQQLRLNCDGGNSYFRDYYGYLYGLPMKLTDPGTIIGSQAKRTDFFGKELWEIRVTYAAEVGADIWYFYFDPDTFALSGYRFYHDEAKNDGEYILLEGEITINGVRFPKERAWYTHQEGTYLGNDDLLPFPATCY